jgi:hypothetical protein
MRIPELDLELEVFQMPGAVAERLAGLRAGEGQLVTAFPVAPGRRADVRIEPVEIFGPSTRFVVVDHGVERLLPRPSTRHFAAVSLDREDRLALHLGPDGRLRGTSLTAAGWYELRPADGGRTVIERLPELGLRFDCSTPDPVASLGGPRHAGAPVVGALPAAANTATYGGILAVDTDTEVMDQRFSNSTSEAADWIAEMMALTNVIYERDLDLHFFLGQVILRIGSDPYTLTGSPVTSAQLSELASHWDATYDDVERTFALLLSGKSSNDLSASGRAYSNGASAYCSTSIGYSVNQIFKHPLVPLASSVFIIAHEVGHNLGSPHTHCYTPAIDHCFSGEGAGCYAGATSCPGGVGNPGTLMSYCHLLDNDVNLIADCGSNLLELHPTVASTMDGYAATAAGASCLSDPIFWDDLETGDLTAWSTSVP